MVVVLAAACHNKLSCNINRNPKCDGWGAAWLMQVCSTCNGAWQLPVGSYRSPVTWCAYLAHLAVLADWKAYSYLAMGFLFRSAFADFPPYTHSCVLSPGFPVPPSRLHRPFDAFPWAVRRNLSSFLCIQSPGSGSRPHSHPCSRTRTRTRTLTRPYSGYHHLSVMGLHLSGAESRARQLKHL